MLPVVSDFLFDEADAVLRELALLNATHDLFLVLIDSAFAFEAPKISSGWIDTIDVETGEVRTISRHALTQYAERAQDWQANVCRLAKEYDLDVVTVGLDDAKATIELNEFVAERRLRKTYN
jgi:hypothetical protein